MTIPANSQRTSRHLVTSFTELVEVGSHTTRGQNLTDNITQHINHVIASGDVTQVILDLLTHIYHLEKETQS